MSMMTSTRVTPRCITACMTTRITACMTTRMTACIAICIVACTGTSIVAEETIYVPGRSDVVQFEAFAADFFQSHCVDCHDGDDGEAGVSLSDLGPVDSTNATLWQTVWTQVKIGEMPPADASDVGVVERLRFTDAVAQQLDVVMRPVGGFAAPDDPGKGNYVDHRLLFDRLPEGIELRPTSTPARLWRLTPDEHLTRLNDLINGEPEHDPDRPGMRAYGDAVPTNHGGELKLYFGVDRIIQWQGGTVAYATAVKSAPAVLSHPRDHGLKNYPHLVSVNGAEATQILSLAEDVLRYMADGPRSIANDYQITDSPRSIADKMKGDLRGLPTSLVYSTRRERPRTPVEDFVADEDADDALLEQTVAYLFEALTFRPPVASEIETYAGIVRDSIKTLGHREGAVSGLSAIFLDRDALFRPELVETGTPDAYGRVPMRDWELALAVNHAFRYVRPDDDLVDAVDDGRMRTVADVREQVRRILSDDSIGKPRVLQFFRDYFDYDRGGYVCKDNRALTTAGVDNRAARHYTAMFYASASMDRLVESILADDRDVLKRLLTTDEAVVAPMETTYYGRLRTEAEQKASRKKTAEQLAAMGKVDPKDKAAVAQRRRISQTNHRIEPLLVDGEPVFARVGRRSFGRGSLKPERTMTTLPHDQRRGILTHPAWLISHSDAMDNHAIRRGRWVRERLLGGAIADVPITVDAMLPDEPDQTLRQRMRVTREDYCWTCHRKMDPLGLPFEMYNHAGVYRTVELDQPVNAGGEIIDSGVAELDGPVNDALDLIDRIADSRRAEEVFVRHAFRFWMGRNETIHDRPVLRQAHRAYREGGGSFNAMLESLLTSDAFRFRIREGG